MRYIFHVNSCDLQVENPHVLDKFLEGRILMKVDV